MGGVLVVGSVADDCAATVEAFRARGVDAVAVSSHVDVDAAAREKEVIIADLDAAIDLGWLRSAPLAVPPRPLIVTSRHEAFLDVVRGRVAGCLRTPFAIDDAIATIQHVLDKSPLPKPTEALPSPLAASGRDAALRRFLDGGADPDLLGVASLVARGTASDCALIAILDSHRQTFVGHAGLDSDLMIEGGTKSDWSFCAHTIAGGERLVVSDARAHPAFAENPLVESKILAAYAGVPITVDGFGVVGTVCVLSREPRTFGVGDFAVLELGARLASERLAHRAHDTPPDEGSRAAPAAAEIEVGGLLGGKYWITAKLAGGGESDVFIARDRMVGRMVVIKWIRRRGDEPLRTEARGLAVVRHPNIVNLYDWGRTADGRSYLVLEHVAGRSLAEVIDNARARGELISFERVVETVRALAGALQSMHALGYAHGDVKPGNVIVDPKLDRPVLIDFGFSIATERQEDGTAATVHGGTPGYSAPEQFMSRTSTSVDARADVYALAALSYAMLTGDGPCDEVGSRDRIAAQIADRISPPSHSRPDVPPALDAVLLRALSSDPNQRPTSVLALVSEIERALQTPVAPVAATDLRRAEPRSRGVAYRVFRATTRRLFGNEEEARIIRSLDDKERAVVETEVEDDAFVPSAPLVAYVRTLAGSDRSRIEAFARAVSGAVLPSAFAALGVTRTPQTVLSAAEPLLHRFHDWGRVDVDRTGPRSARVRLSLPPGFAPELCIYLAELLRVLLRTTGVGSSVTETSCAARGAEACEFAVAWTG